MNSDDFFLLFFFFFYFYPNIFFTFIQIFLLRPAGVLLLLLIHRFRHVTQDKRLFDQLLMRPNLSRCSDVQWLSGDHQTPALSLSLSLCLLLSLSLSPCPTITHMIKAVSACSDIHWREHQEPLDPRSIHSLPLSLLTH